MHDLVYPSRRHICRSRKPILGDAERLQEFLVEDLSWVNGAYVFFCVHTILLMIIGDNYIMRISTFKSEANAPLIVDANTVIFAILSGKLLQPIPGRHSQIGE